MQLFIPIFLDLITIKVLYLMAIKSITSTIKIIKDYSYKVDKVKEESLLEEEKGQEMERNLIIEKN